MIHRPAVMLFAALTLLACVPAAHADRPATPRERAAILPLTKLPACSHRFMVARVATVQGSRISGAWWGPRRPAASCLQSGDGFFLFKRAAANKPWRKWFEGSEGEPCGTNWELSFIDVLGECYASFEAFPIAIPRAPGADTVDCGSFTMPVHNGDDDVYHVYIVRNIAPGRTTCAAAVARFRALDGTGATDDWPLGPDRAGWYEVMAHYEGRQVIATTHSTTPG